MSAADVKRLIEAAFADTPPPALPLVEPTYDDEGVNVYFAGTTWRGHRVEDLRFHEVAMGFFAPEAHRYYLPAFMLASLDSPEEADLISGHILWHFSKHGDPFWAKRISRFASDECDAIIAFLWDVAADGDQRTLERALAGLERQKRRG